MKMHLLLAAFTAALVGLFASPALAFDDTNYNDAVVIVLDASGSMGENMRDPSSGGVAVKIDVARDSIKAVGPQIPSGNHVGLLVFNGSNIRWVYKLGPFDENAFNRAVDSVRADGNTPLGTAMKRGADALMDMRDSQYGYGSYQLLVVTDGEATGNEGSLMKRYAGEITGRGLRLDVIGVDMKGGAQHSLAQYSHAYYAANDAVQLADALSEAVSVESAVGGGELDYSVFEGITHEMGVAVLDELNQPRPNHGIGEQPPPEPEPSTNGGGAVPAQAGTNQQPAGCNSAGAALPSSGALLGVLLGLMAVLVTRQRTPTLRRVPVRISGRSSL